MVRGKWCCVISPAHCLCSLLSTACHPHNYTCARMRSNNWSCWYNYVQYVGMRNFVFCCLYRSCWYVGMHVIKTSSSAVSLHLHAGKLACFSCWVVDRRMFLVFLIYAKKTRNVPMRTHAVTPYAGLLGTLINYSRSPIMYLCAISFTARSAQGNVFVELLYFISFHSV